MFTEGSGSDAREMEAFAERIDNYRLHHPQVRFASPVALVGEVVPSLRRDAPVIIGLALVGLLLATLIASRSLGRTLLVGLTLLVAASTMIGLMTLLDLKISLYNMLVFPLAFGIGVDGAVYVIWSRRVRKQLEGGTDTDPAITFRAVLGSTLTDAAVFASLTVAAFPGLVTLALVALLSILCTLFANLLWLPALIRAAKGRNSGRGTRGKVW